LRPCAPPGARPQQLGLQAFGRRSLSLAAQDDVRMFEAGAHDPGVV
jgi:hypothetical protein